MKIKSTDGDSRCGGRRDWLGIIRKGKGERIGMSNVASRLFPGVDLLGTALKSRKKNSSSLVYVLHKT